jgi:hypothetical protein
VIASHVFRIGTQFFILLRNGVLLQERSQPALTRPTLGALNQLKLN